MVNVGSPGEQFSGGIYWDDLKRVSCFPNMHSIPSSWCGLHICHSQSGSGSLPSPHIMGMPHTHLHPPLSGRTMTWLPGWSPNAACWKFVDEFLAKNEPLHILINNAGNLYSLILGLSACEMASSGCEDSDMEPCPHSWVVSMPIGIFRLLGF